MEELDGIDPALQPHPEVMKVRRQICSGAKEWELALKIAQAICLLAPNDPAGFLLQAACLRFLGNIQGAYDLLDCVHARFPDYPGLFYELARYACLLGRMTEARDLLEAAVVMADKGLRDTALNDPDLKALWES